jgi:hypothetical protein
MVAICHHNRASAKRASVLVTLPSALLVKGYGLDKAKADADVTAWMAGRSF